jgi:glucosamine--fructose-6-phosphate aminotransferase (isomerizing)
VLAIATKGKVMGTMLDMLGRLRGTHSAELVVISNDKRALSLAQSPICLPGDIPEWLSPIISIIPAQLFVYFLCKAKGLDPDSPRTITKITRTE